MKYIASVSFGKDSLAMLLRLIEENRPLDEVVFYNTGVEFDCVYAIRNKVKNILDSKGIKYTELKPKQPFFYTMFDKPVNGKKGLHYGYSWCGGRCRWGTKEKVRAIDKYCKGNYQYIGIAFDEPKRIERAEKLGKIVPLKDWNMTEKDCLQYCHNRGFTWLENGVMLYSILDRVSCWCCANKNKKELFNYYKFLPVYWDKLKHLQSKTKRPFKSKKSIFDLEEEFKLR